MPDETTQQAAVLTIDRFCARNLISPTTYFAMRRRGQGPREMRIGARVLISLEAERDWIRAREVPDAHDQAVMERLRERGRKGGHAAITSTKHHARRPVVTATADRQE
jgi:hypothetical protein